MPGLSNYRSVGLQQGQGSKQELFNEEGGNPVNVMATITPDSLTKMMQRMGQGVGIGTDSGASGASPANPSQGLGASPSTGYSKKGHTGEETDKFMGFNQGGFEKYNKGIGSAINPLSNLQRLFD